jgi:hypothetical protein
MMVCPGIIIGAHNRARVRSWLIAHPGGTQTECARALAMSAMAVGRHVRRIRAEWLGDLPDVEQTVTDSSGVEAGTVCAGGPKADHGGGIEADGDG